MAPFKKNAWAPVSKKQSHTAWAPASKKQSPTASRTPQWRSSARNHDGKCLEGERMTAPSPWKETITAEQYAEIARARPLPASLVGGQLERFRSNVLSVVEGLYRDRISPDLGEVQRRLRRSGWGTLDVQAVLPVCAREPDTYELVLPTPDEPLRILLRSQPPGLHGWVDADMTPNMNSQDVWVKFQSIFAELLKDERPDSQSTGGSEAFALRLQRHLAHCSTFQKEFTLGELLHIVKLSLGCPGGLVYDERHGGRLRISPDAVAHRGTTSLEFVNLVEAPAGTSAAAHVQVAWSSQSTHNQVTVTPQKISLSQQMLHAPTPVRSLLSVESNQWPPATKAVTTQRAEKPRLVNKRLLKADQVAKDSSSDDAREVASINSKEKDREPKQSAATRMDLSELGPEGVAECVLKSLREALLPQELSRNAAALQKFQLDLRSCMESLYRDGIVPTMQEIQQRLSKSFFWGLNEVQAALTLFARDPEQYHIELPRDGQPLRIFLCTPPSWFNGFNSKSTEEGFDLDMSAGWRAAYLELEDSLKSQEVCFEDGLVLNGTIQGAAVELRQHSLPQLQHLALGEVREVVKHMTECGYLKYDGKQLRLMKEALSSEQSESDGSQVSN
mmetsp:Transcript_43328/g.80822  ORF Transcript_43328/g.80822 Transcript_43328/m.80822 type:complete len:617 (+) Transcript_43328:91-1941(+)